MGEKLTAKEQKILDAWYARQDAEDSVEIETETDEFAKALKYQIGKTLQQVSTSLKHIQKLTEENEQLKKENEQLKRLLAQQIGQRLG